MESQPQNPEFRDNPENFHVVSDMFFFHFFPIKAYVKHLTPKRGHFWPKGYNLNKIGRGPLGDAKYQISRL